MTDQPLSIFYYFGIYLLSSVVYIFHKGIIS